MILHVDGDAFFASCEIAQNEALRGQPVVAGADKGIALAVSYDAKKLGISRGMTIKDIRALHPEVIITLSHYDIYRIYSLRMYEIVRRYSQTVEEYSVDECFADLSYGNIKNSENYSLKTVIATAQAIKKDLEQDLGMTFSIGIAPTKVLAKVASKWNKPAGFTIITLEKINEFLKKIPVGKIWGIGPSSSAHLMKHNVRTASDLVEKSEWWVRENLSKPYHEIWHELRGVSLFRVRNGAQHKYKSVMKTGTFRPPTNNPNILLSELAHNVERACRKLRRHNLATQEFSFFVKTQEFRYFYTDVKLPLATSIPTDIIPEIQKHFSEVYNKNRVHRATGVVLRNIVPIEYFQQDIFSIADKTRSKLKLFQILDAISQKYSKDAVRLALSLIQNPKTSKRSITKAQSRSSEFSEKTGIPCWGEAK